MSYLQFIASLVSSLAWPMIVGTVLIVFRKEIISQLQRPLSHLKIGGFEADWEATGKGIKDSLAGAPNRYRMDIKTGVRLGAKVEAEPVSVATPGHRDVVEERWQAVLEVLRSMIANSGAVPDDELASFGYQHMHDEAERLGILDAATVNSLEGLCHLRQLAMVGTNMTESHANEFAIYADAIIFAMQNQPRDEQPS